MPRLRRRKETEEEDAALLKLGPGKKLALAKCFYSSRVKNSITPVVS